MIKLCLFGAVSINDTEGNDLRAALVQTKRTALLAYLTVARPRNSHRRETLLGLFWPDLAEERARRALNQAVYYLRTRLGAESIAVRSADEIALSRAHIACDVVDFENLLAAGEEEKALALYHGPLMDGFHLNDLLEFERWLEIERARLHERAARAAWALADRAAEAGRAQDAIGWARRSMELSRDEGAVRHLISMRDRFGDRAGAIREYDRFARQLAKELEADPSPETQDLIAQIRSRSGTGTPIAPRRAINTPERTPAQGVISDATNLIATAELTGAIVTPRRENGDQARNGSRWRSAFLAVSLPLIALSSWVVYQEMQSRSQTLTVPRTIAILPFSYTGSMAHADASEAVVNLLDANIENAGGVHTVDWRVLKSFVERSTTGPLSLAEASAAAQRFDAEWHIVGAVTEAGGRIRVTAAAYDRRSGASPQVTAIAEGDVRQIFGIVDELTAELLPALKGQSGAH